MNDVAYLGFLFGLGFSTAGGLIICLVIGVTALQRKTMEKLKADK
jgi:high-affinity nickel permease